MSTVKRDPILCMCDVAMRLPKRETLHQVTADTLNEIPAHFHRGIPVRVVGQVKPVIFNIHYYGVGEADLGHTKNGTVMVFEKTMDSGRTFTYVDFTATEGKSVCDFKLDLEAQSIDEDVPGDVPGDVKISGTNAWINFKKREPRQTKPNIQNGAGGQNFRMRPDINPRIDEFVAGLNRVIKAREAARSRIVTR